jgi:hypothetical protein
MILSSWSFLGGLVLLSSLSLVSATWSDYFAGFFPEYNSGFQMLLRDNCSEEYTVYREHRDEDAKIDPILGAFGLNTPHSMSPSVFSMPLQKLSKQKWHQPRL